MEIEIFGIVILCLVKFMCIYFNGSGLEENKALKKYVQGDSRGIMSLTKFSMHPTLHFRNLLCETF
jgi:hypothetical protein